MNRNTKKIRAKNPISSEFKESKELSIQEKIEFTKSLWKWLNMPGTPTEHDVINNTHREEETVRMLRKLEKIEDSKTLTDIKENKTDKLRLSPYTQEEKEFLNLY